VKLGGTTLSGPELLSSDLSEYSVHSNKELKLLKRFIFSIIIKTENILYTIKK
jgi:hypothetical protein